MAQFVGYFEDNVTYKEGPFVLVDANGWRVEVELKGHHCPILPDLSIYEIRKGLGWPVGKTNDTKLAERVCNALNEMVRDGRIVENENGIWTAVQ